MLRIKNDELMIDLTGKKPTFPKYTTQIMNLANQNSQGTRAKIVGQMSDLIQEFPGHKYEEWENWYKQKNPIAIDAATEKILDMIIKLKQAIRLIDKQMVKEWVEDLVVSKTFTGLRFQESILKRLAIIKSTTYRLSNPEEESIGIDGYIGDSPVSIKPITYKSKKMLPEDIKVEIIYYEKKKTGIKVEYNPLL